MYLWLFLEGPHRFSINMPESLSQYIRQFLNLLYARDQHELIYSVIVQL